MLDPRPIPPHHRGKPWPHPDVEQSVVKIVVPKYRGWVTKVYIFFSQPEEEEIEITDKKSDCVYENGTDQLDDVETAEEVSRKNPYERLGRPLIP